MSEILEVPFGNLRLNYLDNKHKIDAAIQSILNSGWFVLGEILEAFETAFADYLGVPYGIGVGSGTEALHLALRACGIKPGDEVLTVSNTCVPTLSAITFAGGIPVLIDIDPTTYTMNPSKIEERITPKTRFVIPVHLYGQCADMDGICEIARRYDIIVIEDCAQAHGAAYKGRFAGTIGDAGCFSFYPSKNLGAYGDAGMVVCQDATIAERVRMLRNYGQSNRYFHSQKGFNSRMDEIQAGILLAKLSDLNRHNQRRIQIATRYTKAFNVLEWIICPTVAKGCHHVFHLYVVRVPVRQVFQDELRRKGIASLIHYPVPIHRQKAYAECRTQSKYLHNTDDQAPHIVSLPIYPELTNEQIEHVINTVCKLSEVKNLFQAI
jgi:dTDP-4-amino-4,6-dideoxygalactose transaminase